MSNSRKTLFAGVGVAALLVTGLNAPVAAEGQDDAARLTTRSVIKLSGPRGVESVRPFRTLVAEDDGSVSLVVERHGKRAVKFQLARMKQAAGFGNAVSEANGRVYFLTGGGDAAGKLPPRAATLYRVANHRFFRVADIKAHQKRDPDPFDQENNPTDTNPYGVLALRDGTVLVADAGGNDLLRVWPNGTVRTVARFKPRMVKVPAGLPKTDPEGNPTGLPPAGTPIRAEAVPTSITVGRDGAWYVGELRGFPGTPGTSQIWRIRPGTVGATCDPARPHRGRCTRFADRFTSIVDLATGGKGRILALSLSKKSWLKMELGVPGAEVGALTRYNFAKRSRHEVAKGKLIMPGGVDVARNGVTYVTGPVFGPGKLLKIR
jgi:hypothetical protein